MVMYQLNAGMGNGGGTRMSGSLHDRLGELALNSGKVTPAQIEEARGVAAKMLEQGIKWDILDVLVDRNVLDLGEAEEIRTSAASPSAGAWAEEAGAVPAAGEPSAGAALARGTRCFFHPDRPAFVSCRHCRRPICSDCVVRTDRGSFCSETCLVGSSAAAEAQSAVRRSEFARTVRVGRLIFFAGVAAIVIGAVWVVKWVIDDYRFTSAMNRAREGRITQEEALGLLRKAVDLRPGSVEARVALGKAMIKSGEAGAAIEQLSCALRREPDNREGLSAIVEAHVIKHGYKEASEALLRLGEIGAADSDSERRLGMIYQDHLERPQEAVEAFRRALKIGSESRELRLRIGRAHLALGNPGEAREELTRAVVPVREGEGPTAGREKAFLADRKRVADIYEALASIAEKEGDQPALLVHLARAQRAAPGRLSLVKKRTRLLVDGGQHEEALRALEQSAKALSRNPEYLDILSRVQDLAGADAERLKTLRKLYRLSPQHPGVLRRLATAEAAAGQTQRARQLLESLPREKRMSVEFAEMWVEIARADLSGGRVAGAEQVLRSLGPRAEGDPRFASVWCEVLYRQGRHDEALRRAELAIRRAPDDPVPHLIAGSVLRSLGRGREALEKLRTAARLGGGGQVQFELGMVSWQAGLREEVARCFLAALRDPKLPRYRRHEAELYLSRLRGPGLAARDPSPVIAFLRNELSGHRADKRSALRHAHLASYGIARLFSLIAGTVGPEPVGDELAQLRKIKLSAMNLDDPEALVRLRGEFDRGLKSCAQAARDPARSGGESDIRKALADHDREASEARQPFARMAAAARAQVDLVASWLRHHPRGAEASVQVDAALRRMKARRALAPGDIQGIVSADYALAEVLATAVACGPGAFVYETAVDGVMSDLAAMDAAAEDPPAQLRAGRIAAFRMLWILYRQIREMGNLPAAKQVPGGGI